jgi:hypothetical protein
MLLPGRKFRGIEFEADGVTVDFTNFRRDTNPAYEEWTKAQIRTLCPYGYCTIWTCNICGKIDSAMGPIGCPCDLTRGWKAKRIESMGKPHPAIKPTGRHKGKIERRRREQKEYERRYGRLVEKFGP